MNGIAPVYLTGTIDRDEAERIEANARELSVDHNVTVERDRVRVIATTTSSYLCVHADGKSRWWPHDRVWADPPRDRSLIAAGG